MWITACVVLYNILLTLNDLWSEEECWWTAEDEEQYDTELLSLTPPERQAGSNKREAVMRMVLEKTG